ncbi:MAG: hypothetical protein U5J83_03855 [Bryobacterales bacterium]|nr:hypothetical protein [Bryobacterales bacterium]
MQSSFALLRVLTLLASLSILPVQPWAQNAEGQRVEAKNGYLLVEAEAFDSQDRDSLRRWRVQRPGQAESALIDGDPSHAQSASGRAYLEVLPDTRRTHGDKLLPGENFSNLPGAMAVLFYKVKVAEPGRYYVWVRAYSTGPEDNGIHVGLNGAWPESGRRMQWCGGRDRWRLGEQRATRPTMAARRERSSSILRTPESTRFSFPCGKTASNSTNGC